MQKIIFTEKVLDECVQEMTRGYQEGVATVVYLPRTERAEVVVMASKNWRNIDPDDGIKVLDISDTDGHGGYIRAALNEPRIEITGHPEILHVWDLHYDEVLAAARAILAGRPEDEQEEIASVQEIDDILDQDETDRLVRECEGMWYTLDDAQSGLIESMFEDLRERGYEPGILDTLRVEDRDGGAEECEILELNERNGATVYRVSSSVGSLLVVQYEDGTQYTPHDWQAGGYDEIPEDLSEIRWVRQDGAPAVMLDGLPRNF